MVRSGERKNARSTKLRWSSAVAASEGMNIANHPRHLRRAPLGNAQRWRQERNEELVCDASQRRYLLSKRRRSQLHLRQRHCAHDDSERARLPERSEDINNLAGPHGHVGLVNPIPVKEARSELAYARPLYKACWPPPSSMDLIGKIAGQHLGRTSYLPQQQDRLAATVRKLDAFLSAGGR